MKNCCYCGQEKPLGEFYQSRPGQRVSRCKKCYGLAARTCRVCGGTFVGKAKQTICSEMCAANYRPQTYRDCAVCGKRFGPVDHAGIKCCSRECGNAIKQGRASPLRGKPRPNLYRSPTRKCLVCEATFRATADFKGKHQVYCSHRCYLTNRRVSIPERMAGEWLASTGLIVEPQKRIGRWCFDFFLPDIRLIVEVDGAFWHSSPTVKERDARKDAAVAAMGFQMLRVDAEDVRRDPAVALGSVIVSRWQAFTGVAATLEGDGRTFAEIAAHRAQEAA